MAPNTSKMITRRALKKIKSLQCTIIEDDSADVMYKDTSPTSVATPHPKRTSSKTITTSTTILKVENKVKLRWGPMVYPPRLPNVRVWEEPLGFDVYDYFTEEEVEGMNYPRSKQQVNFEREAFWCRFCESFMWNGTLAFICEDEECKTKFCKKCYVDIEDVEEWWPACICCRKNRCNYCEQTKSTCTSCDVYYCNACHLLHEKDIDTHECESECCGHEWAAKKYEELEEMKIKIDADEDGRIKSKWERKGVFDQVNASKRSKSEE